MATPQSKTSDGFETQFGTNHLGHFVLVNRIAKLLKHNGGRLVNLSSAGHRFADVDLDDPGFAHTEYAPFVAYGRSKTANILFAVEFDRRHKDQGIRATAVHPGGIQTELGRTLTPETTAAMIKSIEDAPRQPAPHRNYRGPSAGRRDQCGRLRRGGCGRQVLRGLPRRRDQHKRPAQRRPPMRSTPSTRKRCGPRAEMVGEKFS